MHLIPSAVLFLLLSFVSDLMCFWLVYVFKMHFHHAVSRKGAGLYEENNCQMFTRIFSSSLLRRLPFHFPKLGLGWFFTHSILLVTPLISLLLFLDWIPIGQGLRHPFLPCIKCRNVLNRFAYQWPWERWWCPRTGSSNHRHSSRKVDNRLGQLLEA